MTRLTFAMVLCAALAVDACVKDAGTGQDKDTSVKRPAKPGELADSPPASDRKPMGRDQPRAAGAETPDVCALLSAKEIEEIAGVYSTNLDLPKAFLEDYLRFNIDYDLGPGHVEGLTRFYQLAFDSGLIPEVRPVRFLPLGIQVESPAR